MSLSENVSHPDDDTRQTTDTRGFKPFTTVYTAVVVGYSLSKLLINCCIHVASSGSVPGKKVCSIIMLGLEVSNLPIPTPKYYPGALPPPPLPK